VGIIERKPVPVFAESMKAFLDWSKQEHKEHPATYQRYNTSSKPLLAYPKFKGKAIDEITPATIEEYKSTSCTAKGQGNEAPNRSTGHSPHPHCRMGVRFSGIV
jgi:hypothetical protein